MHTQYTSHHHHQQPQDNMVRSLVFTTSIARPHSRQVRNQYEEGFCPWYGWTSTKGDMELEFSWIPQLWNSEVPCRFHSPASTCLRPNLIAPFEVKRGVRLDSPGLPEPWPLTQNPQQSRGNSAILGRMQISAHYSPRTLKKKRKKISEKKQLVITT